MKNIMKKLALTAAFGCTMFTAAFADGNTHTGPFQVQVQDFITIDPSGDFNYSLPTLTFNNPQQMIDGLEIGPQKYKVTASRAWKVTVKASDFQLQGDPASASVATSIPTATHYQLRTEFATIAPSGHLYTAQPFTFIPNAGVVVAQGDHGGINIEFNLFAKFTPGLASNLSGLYESDVQVIASLD